MATRDATGSIADGIDKLKDTASTVYKQTKEVLDSLHIPVPINMALAGIAALAAIITYVIIAVAVAVLIPLGTPLIIQFMNGLTKVRTDSVPEQLEISRAVLSEFLATEIPIEHMKAGKTGDQTIDAARAIGKGLLDRLTKEFVPQGTVTPESGEAAAQTFAGYGVNFAVQNTMISTLADALSYHLLEDFRELGIEVAQNIGLGRLVRQSIMPLVRNAIAEPYDQQLRKRYRPDLLSEQHAVDAFFSGFIADTELKETLARKGYSDAYIAIVTERLRKKITEDNLDTLLRYGIITRDQAEVEVQSQGYSNNNAKLKLRVQELQRVDTLIGIYKNLISKQRSDGLLDQDAYNKLLDRLPISDDEKQWELNYTGQVLELPRAFLSWTEVKKAFELGSVDLDYVDRWLAREGFSDEDQLVRELQMFDELGIKTEKAAAAAAKASRKKT